jgi:hypothetical protein
MQNELLDIIRTANREFQEFIHHVARNGLSHDTLRRVEADNVRLRQFSAHLAVGARSARGAPEPANEFLSYMETLRTLRSTIGSLQSSLLAEKVRLDNIRANLRSARAWAASLRGIS